MSIDIERLKVDESMWPARATHYDPVDGDWMQLVDTGEWYASGAPKDTNWWGPTSDPDVLGDTTRYIPRPKTQVTGWLEPGSKWEHHSGRVYRIVLIANVNTERPDQYPVTVVYENVDNGTVWSRPLDDWFRSFKPCQPKASKGSPELNWTSEPLLNGNVKFTASVVPTEWDGEGLPPVGCEYEFRRKGVSDRIRWSRGTPEAIKQMNDNPTYCIWMREHTDNGKGFSWHTLWAHEYDFRPIRTKEQRERDALVSEIKSDLDAYGLDNSAHLAGCLVIGMINRGWTRPE